MTTDESYEALADVTGSDWNVNRGELNKALMQIREQEDDDDVADRIRERAELYRRSWPEIALTPTALAKHWKRMTPSRKTQGTNLTAVSDCLTCGGDRFLEQEDGSMKPCPDCGPKL